MNRNIFSIAPWVLLLALSVPAQAQQPTKLSRVGLLLAGSASSFSNNVQAFRQGLRELGYVEGKNFVIEYRYADGKQEQLPHLASDLAHLKVDVIVVSGEQVARAVKNASSTIPIVLAVSGDPVGGGLAASLAHPSGNITGLTQMASELSGKRLELLKEVLPRLSTWLSSGSRALQTTAHR